MRYQVRVDAPADYGRIVALLRDKANVLLEIPRRRTLAVEGLENGLRERVVSMGATVIPDYEYKLDPALP